MITDATVFNLFSFEGAWILPVQAAMATNAFGKTGQLPQ
jgi:hypothetical protein